MKENQGYQTIATMSEQQSNYWTYNVPRSAYVLKCITYLNQIDFRKKYMSYKVTTKS